MLGKLLIAASAFGALIAGAVPAHADNSPPPPPPGVLPPIDCKTTVDAIVNVPTCFDLPGGGKFLVQQEYAITHPSYGEGVELILPDGSGFLAESEGSGDGLRSTVEITTPAGTIMNEQNYGTNYQGHSCLICNQFGVYGPKDLGSPPVLVANTDVLLNGMPTVDIQTPAGDVNF